MSIFGKSTEKLLAERDKLDALIGTTAMDLAGRRVSMEETHRELIPLTTRLIEINNEILRKTSVRNLRKERAELELSVGKLMDQHASIAPGSHSAPTRQQLLRAEMMQLEQKIDRIDQHLAHRPKDASIKEVVIIFLVAAIAVFIQEWLSHTQ
jgi:chromosome segregation ATPase